MQYRRNGGDWAASVRLVVLLGTIAAATAASLGLKVFATEPYPTFAMPGFAASRATDQRNYEVVYTFRIVQDGKPPLSLSPSEFYSGALAQSYWDVVSVEFFQDNTDPEVRGWVSTQARELAPNSCDAAVFLVQDTIDTSSSSSDVLVSSERRSLGTVLC